MFGVGQNGKLRIGLLNSACGLVLRLDGKRNDLCSLFFKLGLVFYQPTELVKAWLSGVVIIKNQDDHLVV